MSYQEPKYVELESYITNEELSSIINAAKREDLGPQSDDITSRLLVDAHQQSTATFTVRQPGILSGIELLPAIAKEYDPAVKVNIDITDATNVKPGDTPATLTGPLRSILAIERVALNFLTHLSGIATLANQYVLAISHTNAEIWDTRKTHAGLRALEKYAVKCGGAINHRIGLYDAILVKDNHIAHLSNQQLAKKLTEISAAIKSGDITPTPTFIDVEVDNLDQLKAVLPTGIDMVLLDNMPPDKLSQAIAMRDEIAPNVKLEASGGVDLNSVAAIAESGVDYISVGAITHSAIALDLGLDIK